MSVTPPKELLDQLAVLEISLSHFSFETLRSKEAIALKQAYSEFRSKLELKIFDPRVDLLEKGFTTVQDRLPTLGLNGMLLPRFHKPVPDPRFLTKIKDNDHKPVAPIEPINKIAMNKKENTLPEESLKLLQKKVIEMAQKDTICIDTLYEDCLKDISVLEELLRLFKQNVYEFIGAVKMNLELNDFHKIALAAHKLKAGLTMVNAHRLRAIVEEMEAHSKLNDEQAVQELYKRFLVIFPNMEKEMDASFYRIKNA